MTSILKVDRIESRESGGNVTFGSPINPDGFSSNYRPGEIIETLGGVCYGQTIIGTSGTYTWPNVTAKQDQTASYASVTGSQISYTPPSGTKHVNYRFQYKFQPDATEHNIGHYYFAIDSVEVLHSRFSTSANNAYEDILNFDWVIDIGGSDDTDVGSFATWASAKTLQMFGRNYDGSGNENDHHGTRYWHGTTGNQFNRPKLFITAIA